MAIKVYNIDGDSWTPITAAGAGGTCWLQEIPGKGQVVINHSDTLTEFSQDESYFLLNAKRRLQPFSADSGDDVYYARCSTPGCTAVLITDTGPGFVGGGLIPINSEGNVPVSTEQNGYVCEDNTTDIPLGIDGVFAGVWQDTLNYNTLIIGIKADQDSAIDGLKIEWSADGITAHDDDIFTVLANKGKVFTFSPARRYLKITYTNGAAAQSVFNLQTVFKKGGFKSSSHRTSDAIVGEDDAELVKATITGEGVASGDFVNVGAIAGEVGNNLLVSVDQVEMTTNSLKVIDYSHAELHSGNHYVYRRYHTIAKNGGLDHVIITPDIARWAHMTIAVDNTSGGIIVELYEGTVTSDDGAIEPSINRNRNFPDDNTTEVYEGPTVTSVGTLLFDVYLGAGKNKPGGAARDSEEIILKQNTKYLLRVDEQNIEATEVNIVFDWYEHTNK